MIKNKLLFILLIVILLLLMGCTPKHSNTPTIAATIFPLQDITHNITQKPVLTVIPAGANPHTFTPTPSLVKQLIRAELVIAISPEFDGWITKYVPKSKVLFLQKSDHTGDHHAGHNHSKNPHIWLTPTQGIAIAIKVQQKLCTLKKENCATYQKNLTAFKAQLNKLSTELTQKLLPIKGKGFIQWHPAWNQFAKTFQFNILNTVEHGHGDSPSVKHFHGIIESGQKEKPAGLLVGINQNSAASETLIKELSIPKIKLDSIGGSSFPDRNSYIKLLQYNSNMILKGVSKGQK